MAMKWNWKRVAYGSAAILVAVSTAVAFGPGESFNSKLEALDLASPQTIPEKPLFVPIKSSAKGEENFDDVALGDAIEKSRKLCKRLKAERGLPGLSVAVSVNGKMVWQQGFGFASLENNVRMKPESILRIASISKSMTMAMLAKLMEEGRIDIDKPIQTYLPSFPEKYVDGERVTITTRHLLSHLSGIRHYEKKEPVGPGESATGSEKRREEMKLPEYFIKEKYDSVDDALKLFQDDELFHKPGTAYLYTTHGWTVVSAIIEKLTETKFATHSKRMFDIWGLLNTHLDQHDPLIYNRASYYTRFGDGEIVNAPYVDNSYKWAGGGFLSNVVDLNKFANILLYSMQSSDGPSAQCATKGLPKIPFLSQSTMKTIWTGNPATFRPGLDILYALGFEVGEPLRKCVFCKERDLKVVRHGGAAIGSSSTLLLAFPLTKEGPPKDSDSKVVQGVSEQPQVKGIVVAMITNMTGVSMKKVAEDVANNFRILL